MKACGHGISGQRATVAVSSNVYVMQDALFVPLPCYICGQETRDTLTRGTSKPIPACVEHTESLVE